MRRSVVPVVAVIMALVLTACGGGSGSKKKKKHKQASRPAAVAPAKRSDDDRSEGRDSKGRDSNPAPSGSPTRRPPNLTCADLRNTPVGSRTKPYHRDYPGPLTLRNGQWTGNGATVQVERACSTGDLDGDDLADAVSAVVLNAPGVDQLWSLVVWRNVAGQPRYVTTVQLGNRTAVQSIRISGQHATVVYLTRSPKTPPTTLDIRRTAVYRMSGSGFLEVSHRDTAHTT